MALHPISRGAVARVVALLAGLLLALAIGPSAHAVTSITVDGHPAPVTLTVGETITLRFDVSKTGGTVQWRLARDLARAGRYDPAFPVNNTSAATDAGAGDVDPAPGKIALQLPITPSLPAGPYLFQVADQSDGSSLATPVWTVLPKPEPQSISGRVTMASGVNQGVAPTDAVVWAYSDPQTPAASANIQPDGSYSLPLSPGSYILFAEWFGNLHSQRQFLNLVAGQSRGNVDLPLLQGQEVGGTVRDAGQPMRDAIVQATAVSGAVFTARTFADGSYVLVLPPGSYRLTAPGGAENITVTNQPIDGVDFPPATAGPAPAAGTIVTVAGNGLTGLGGNGRPATSARLPNPVGAALDAAGNFYIADSVASRVYKVNAGTDILTTVAGSTLTDTIRFLFPFGSNGGFSGDGGPAVAAEFNRPQWLTVDTAGNLYIADVGNHRVRKVDPQGKISTVAGSGPGGLGAPGGFGGDGGPATAARFNLPLGVAVDAAGNLYIADSRNLRVRKVSLDGNISTVAGGGTAPFTEGAVATAVDLSLVGNLAVDPAGNLYIGGRGLNRILKVTPAGIVSTVAGTGKAGYSGDGGPAAQAEINFPVGIALDRAGNLFFSDNTNHWVRKVSADGIITTVVGTGEVGSSGDGGPAAAARITGPAGVAIDSAGNLYVSDNLSRRVRKVIGIAAPGVFAGR